MKKAKKLYAHGDKQNGKLVPGVPVARSGGAGKLGRGTSAAAAKACSRYPTPGVMQKPKKVG